MSSISPAKFADELAAQRFQMLEDLTKELEGEVVFPTCFEVAVRMRQVLSDPDVSIERLAVAVRSDPLISSKLLALANSTAYGGDQPIRDVSSAIQRLGVTVVRTTGLAIAMRQMLLLRGIVAFDDIANQLWQHSLLAASASYVVAHRMTAINPDEAYFAGLVHDIGAFYMLFHATKYPELVARPESLKHLVVQWHESIGVTLLESLGVPENVAEATRDHDVLRESPVVPRNLRDLVYVGNILAGSYFEWRYQDTDSALIERYPLGPQYLALSEEIHEHARSMTTGFS
jgi:HD-like signal output (HDOD) protein